MDGESVGSRMSALLHEDEEYVGHARIYHRYHIQGWRSPGGQTSLSAIQQLPLPIVSEVDERKLVSSLADRPNSEVDELARYRLRELAQQESARLESSLKAIGINGFPGFEEYMARHEDQARLVVRLFRTDFSNPKQVHQFRAFRCIDRTPDIFLFNAPGQLADALLRRLAKASGQQLDISYPQLDLQRLADATSSVIRGASFGITGRPNLKTAMVFGQEVNQDESWEEYSRIGQLKYVHLQLIFESTEVKMMVTRRGSLMPYGIDNVHEELRLCRDVYEQSLQQFEIGNTNLIKRRSTR